MIFLINDYLPTDLFSLSFRCSKHHPCLASLGCEQKHSFGAWRHLFSNTLFPPRISLLLAVFRLRLQATADLLDFLSFVGAVEVQGYQLCCYQNAVMNLYLFVTYFHCVVFF